MTQGHQRIRVPSPFGTRELRAFLDSLPADVDAEITITPHYHERQQRMLGYTLQATWDRPA